MKNLFVIPVITIIIIICNHHLPAQDKFPIRTPANFHTIKPDSIFQKPINKSTDSIYYIDLPLLKDEFTVNYGCGDYGAQQYSVNVASDNEGNYCVAWTDLRNGTEDIYAQVFDKNDNRIGINVLVSENNIEWNTQPHIAATPEGNYIISWASSGYSISAQILSGSGQKIGNNFIVNSSYGINTNDPCVAVDDSSNIAITWTMQNGSWERNMYARFFDKFGNPKGDEFKINNSYKITGGSIGYGNRIAVDSSGTFGIVWSEYYFGTSKIILQLIDAENGMVGNNVLVSDAEDPNSHIFPSISATKDGYFLIGWEASGYIPEEVAAKIYKSGAGFVTDKIVFNPDTARWASQVRISSDKENNFLLFWSGDSTYAEKISKTGNWYSRNNAVPINNWSYIYTSNISNGSVLLSSTLTVRTDYDASVQKMDTAFNFIGDKVKVNDDDCSAFQILPSVCFNPYGESIVVWEDMRNGYRELYAQLYDSSFVPINANILLNDSTVTSWWDLETAVTSLSNGSYLISFIQKQTDWDSYIYFQKIARDGSKIGSNKLIVDEGYKRNIYLNSNGSDEILLVWTDSYNNAYIQKFDSDLNPLTEENHFFKSYEGSVSRRLKSISINDNLDVMATWLNTIPNSNEYENLLYSCFYNSEGTIISTQNVIDTLYESIYALINCRFDNDKNYIVTQNNVYGIKVKNKYVNDTTQYIHYFNVYNANLQNSRILNSKNKKSLFTIRSENEIIGYFIDNNRNVVKIFKLHTFENPSLTFGYEYKSYDTKMYIDKLFVTYTANKINNKGYDIWAKVFNTEELDFSYIPPGTIIPENYDVLYGNFPNPVNGITKIAFKLFKPHRVKITLYDILGNRTGIVFDEFLDKGYQEASIDVTNLSSGVYIYKIEANNKMINKFVVLK